MSQPSRTQPKPETDGVFANMSAKPEAPPSYDNDDSPPPGYFEETIYTVSEEGHILIDGFPVGEPFSLIVNAFVSTCFDFIGFLMTMLLSNSHAARVNFV
jgi:hypothetical protein